MHFLLKKVTTFEIKSETNKGISPTEEDYVIWLRSKISKARDDFNRLYEGWDGCEGTLQYYLERLRVRWETELNLHYDNITMEEEIKTNKQRKADKIILTEEKMTA